MNNFRLYSKCKNLIIYSEKYVLNNIPKVYSVYRKKMEEAIIELNYNIIRANSNEGNIRSKYQKEFLISLQMVDLYVSILNDLKIGDKKKLIIFTNMLDEIRKVGFSWINNEKKK